MRTLILSFILLLPSICFSYYGIHSTEAILEFDGRIETQLPAGTKLSNLKSNHRLAQELREEIDQQIQYLIGSFASESYRALTNGATATISNDYKIQFTAVDDSHILEDHHIVSYQFRGKILVHRDFFGAQGKNLTGKIPVILPLNPQTIYYLGLREISVPVDEHNPRGPRELTEFNLCTDDHYNSEGDFFYFWDPERINRRGRSWRYPNCPLIGDKENVLRLTGKLTRLPNTYQKYLDYHRLYAKKKLKISVFLGYLDDVVSYTQVNTEDVVIEGWQEILERLEQDGFELVELIKAKRFSTQRGFYGKGINFYHRFQKLGVERDAIKIGEKNKTIDIEIEVLLADTAIGSSDKAFHHFYRQALKNSDIVIYDGHSGLGANLDLETIGANLSGANHYQVIYLNGCSGYPYFKDMYFNAKKGGSKNLDLILSGLSTYSDTLAGNIMAFMEGFMHGKTLNTSYILQKIEAANVDANGSYLTGILGEEDNVWQKPQE